MMPRVFRALDNVLGGTPPWQINLCGLALIALVGALDHLTGFELSFSVFYLLPIVLAGWYATTSAALAMSVVSAFTWLAMDYTSGHAYSEAWMLFWNAGVRLVFFLLVTYLTAQMKLRLQAERISARTDPLTGLRNPLAFDEEADLLFKSAKRYRHPVSVGYIDLDGFKAVNDARGHAEGNRALRAVAATLQLSIRESDIAARIGGDEFAVVLPHTDAIGARTFFDRLHARLTRAMQEEGWPVGFSIGVAVFPDTVPGYADALKSADMLMYRVKSGSRNSIMYEVFSGAERAPSDPFHQVS